METKKGYILVEGKGEVEAMQNLVTRLSNEIGLYLPWAIPRRWVNLQHWEAGTGSVSRGAAFIRSKSDASALLIVKDEDDGCPKELAPQVSSRLREMNLPFPTAYILLKPEYEVLFLPCLEEMNLPCWDMDSWEGRRGIKEWLSRQLPYGRSYKPTVDQLPMTRQLNFEKLRSADVPCFGSLVRALTFLGNSLDTSGSVYP